MTMMMEAHDHLLRLTIRERDRPNGQPRAQWRVFRVRKTCRQCRALAPRLLRGSREFRARIAKLLAAGPACGTAMHPVHDLFHRAMQRALEQSGSVEIVQGAAEKRLIEVGGGLGALLRYPSPVPQQVARS